MNQSLPPLRDVIARHGLSARKVLGQHFLLDLNLTGRIARAVPGFLSGSAGNLAQGTVIEIGPGPGGLTRALLAEGTQRLIAVEKDRRCLDALGELAAAYPGRLELIEADALELDITGLGFAPRRVVANLPYNISTVLLLGWLRRVAEDPQVFAGLVLMFQKEVADRLCARPPRKAYGRLSVLTQWLCEVRALFDVPPRAFTPSPSVVSTVVGLRPRPHPLAAARLETLERVTAAAFGQRRKMLRQSLRTLEMDATALLRTAGVRDTGRPEELSIEEFCALARVLDAES